MTTFRRGLTGQVNAPRLRYTLLLRPDNIQTTAVVVGFHCDLISRELARQGVRRGAGSGACRHGNTGGLHSRSTAVFNRATL